MTDESGDPRRRDSSSEEAGDSTTANSPAEVPTTCMRCAVGCGLVHVVGGGGDGSKTVRGDPSNPVSRGAACRRGIHETANPRGERLTRPLVREDGELVPTSWSTAVSKASEAIRSAMATDPDDVAILGSGQQTNEAAYALGKLARAGIGTRNYDANTTLCMASAVAAYYRAFGSDAPPPTYDDIPAAETHLVWGANPAVAHPVLFQWIRQSAVDGRLIVVDPVETKTATAADEHVAVAPGRDLELARAVLAHLVDTGRIDESFVDAATTGFDEVVADLPSVADAAADAGVSLETVEMLAAAFDDPTLVYWGMGVNQSIRGTATAGALIDLCLASGNLGPGSGPFSLTGQANSMGTRVCSSKGTWPGHRPFDHPGHRQAVADAWSVPVSRLPDDAGPGPVGVLDSSPSVVWTVATNPVAGFPDATTAIEHLEDAFLVAQDAFRSETVELADVVFPAATWGETEGTTVNMERRVSRVRPAIDPPADARSDLDIVADVASQVAPGLLPDSPADPAAVFDEFVALTAGTNADCSGLSYARLDREQAVRWPAPEPDTSAGYRYDGGSDPASWSFPTPSGKARFSTLDGDPLPEPTGEDFPLTLTTGRETDAYNTGVRSRGGDTAVSDDASARPVARVNPETIETYRGAVVDADHGRTTSIESRRASVRVTLAPDDAVPKGLVWLPIHHPLTNTLTTPAVDPVSNEPNFKQCAVRFRRSGGR
ncbi:molybdopterin-dependent oxidoreductase [Haloferax sp. MBLA0076]|uniref:Molybdopterin-dependent oxidoreductase n=1 Tax=Haloferax litoreum TaxID=2666140 RepID=A0A6A8GFI5_9EURY|nr:MULTISPECIES: assimilatory nitrate reductase NasA [Haloferax]KAB1193131.1 molybdopterin-dependent oxidoreductase [Haloferax sp. CBA1148]MRX21626.1 molybdopterin-dependent oxidoreductase [Haloferax litoreum]